MQFSVFDEKGYFISVEKLLTVEEISDAITPIIISNLRHSVDNIKIKSPTEENTLLQKYIEKIDIDKWCDIVTIVLRIYYLGTFNSLTLTEHLPSWKTNKEPY